MPTYAVNKKARFDYEILDTLEAGLVLSGAETKSVRGKNVKMAGSYISLRSGEAFLIGLHIPKYRYAGTEKDYDPDRPRKLLLSKRELRYLSGKSQEKGLTIIPLSLYTKGRYIKAALGIARGKKKYDKKETIKRRDLERDMRRELRGRV